MPGGNRMGPSGAGPRTGRGMGYCSDYDRPGYSTQAAGFRGRFGFGRGRGWRGWRHRFFATDIPGGIYSAQEQETADLKAQADLLRSQLDAIQRRVDELTAK